MARARINCPNCRQPILADIQQIFDIGEDPGLKPRLLSGMFNFVQCPVCGYQGNLASPIVYHDPGKELLLTYIPPELGLPQHEQERIIGSLINQVINRLPAEQRKGYLLRPQAHLTIQGLVERVLEADGITKEMIQAQQKRSELLQRLVTATDDDVRLEILRQEAALVDAELFSLLSRLLEMASATQDQESAAQLAAVHALLLEHTEVGRNIKQQSLEIQEAIKSLQTVGRELTREKLLDMILDAPNEVRLSALVSLARPGLDYQFFQLLSERIEKESGAEKERLLKLRENLLEITRQIDLQLEARASQARKLLEDILAAKDITAATQESLDRVDDFFIRALNEKLEASRKSGDLDLIGKLQQINGLIQRATTPPPEIQFIEDLLDAPDEESRQSLLEKNEDKITDEFLQVLSGLASQIMETQQDPELVERFKAVNRHVLRFSMQANLRGG
jgi:hypothetical protein